MPAISYSKKNVEKYNFTNKILEGSKKHTIRKYRKNWTFKKGDRLVHYAMQRSPKGYKIIENTCLYVADIFIDISSKRKLLKIIINKKRLYGYDLLQLAKNDGFNCFSDFKNYFKKSGLPFRGQIVGWVEGISYE